MNVLAVYDTRDVVAFSLEDRLHTQMQTAFEWITGNHNIKTKFNTNMTVARLNEFKYRTGMDREYYLSNVQQLQRDRCKSYVEPYEKHKRYFSQQ